MIIKIGRSSGPCTDLVVESNFHPDQLNIIEDVIAMVNKATNNKEKWYVELPSGSQVVPVARETT